MMITSEEDKRKDFLNKSNERLRQACLKKIDTTMIGSLDIVEKEINEIARNFSREDGIILRDTYSRIRSKILDNGNNQKRATNEEFKHYTVSWNMYTLTMPVKSRVNREETDE